MARIFKTVLYTYEWLLWHMGLNLQNIQGFGLCNVKQFIIIHDSWHEKYIYIHVLREQISLIVVCTLRTHSICLYILKILFVKVTRSSNTAVIILSFARAYQFRFCNKTIYDGKCIYIFVYISKICCPLVNKINKYFS